MLHSTPATSHLWVTWDDYHHKIEQLAVRIHASGWQFDHILCLARGGLRPGDVLSRVFDVPLAILSTSSYREAAGTKQGGLHIGAHITMTAGTMRGSVLLVDDLVDSGDTIYGVMTHLRAAYPQIGEIKVATIWHKASSTLKPDFVVDYLDNNPWIHQPFEQYDSLRPEQLAARWRVGEKDKNR